MRSRLLAQVILVALVVVACSSAGAPTAPSGAPTGAPTTAPSAVPVSPSPIAAELTIYAAASLKAALEATRAAYEAANPGTTLVISTDASSALEVKIEQGAPADVFLSA